jgi:hypothetical protein
VRTPVRWKQVARPVAIRLFSAESMVLLSSMAFTDRASLPLGPVAAADVGGSRFFPPLTLGTASKGSRTSSLNRRYASDETGTTLSGVLAASALASAFAASSGVPPSAKPHFASSVCRRSFNIRTSLSLVSMSCIFPIIPSTTSLICNHPRSSSTERLTKCLLM